MQSPGSSKKIETLVLFPGALGDFLCLLPALAARRAATHGNITVAANGDGLELLQMPATTCLSLQRREISDLFRSGDAFDASTVALLGGFHHGFSWTGSGDAGFRRRLAQLAAAEGRVEVYPFRGMRRGEHAAAYFHRCLAAGAEPLRVDAPETAAAVRPHLVIDRDWLAAFVALHGLGGRPLLVVHPGSGSVRKNWPGFPHAIADWRRIVGREWRIVEICGPAEAGSPPLPDATRAEGLRLPQVAALLERADAYLGNDSGIAHLAAIVGTRGCVLFGPSDPATWRPLGGGLEVVHRPEACAACGDVLCLHRLEPRVVAEKLADVARITGHR